MDDLPWPDRLLPDPLRPDRPCRCPVVFGGQPFAARAQVPPRPRFFRAGSALIVALACLLGLCSGCAVKKTTDATRRDGPFFTAAGTPLTDAELVSACAGADFILVGERHDNATDHAMQVRLLSLLGTHGIKAALGLEMLPRRRYQPALDAFSAGALSIDALPEALDWPVTWGFDFALYRPLFQTAFCHQMPLYGLNIPHEVRRAVGGAGLSGLSDRERGELPSRLIPPLAEQEAMLRDFFRGHARMMSVTTDPAGKTKPTGAEHRPAPGSPAVSPAAGPQGGAKTTARLKPPLTLERFLFIQSLWDNVMAEEADRIRTAHGGPVVILAGVGHVERGWGIAHRLKVLSPQARIVLVMPFSGPEPEPGLGDLFYASPAAPRPRLGMELRRTDGRLVAAGVVPGSRAANAGLKTGDILVAAGDLAITSPSDLHTAAVALVQGGKPLRLQVERQGSTLFLLVR